MEAPTPTPTTVPAEASTTVATEASNVATVEKEDTEELIPLTAEQEAKYQLIVRNLKEVIGKNAIRKVLQERDIRVYWGTATTGKPHLGYFVPMYKIADFLQAGCHVTILFADLHAYLDNMKSDWDQLQARCQWYEWIIKELLTLIGVPLEKLKFIKGTDYQLSPKYTMDVYKMSALVTTEHTTKAGAEVVKMTQHPLMSNLLYPILQALDEQYLDVDVQFGGVDQRKIFTFARTHLPHIGYAKRSHLLNPLIPGLGKSGKMSSSEPLSKVDFDDSDAEIMSKFKAAFSVDGQPSVLLEDGVTIRKNGMLAMLKYVLFRYLEKQGKPFTVPRPAKWGGPQTFNSYKEVKAAFSLVDGPDVLKSGDLKTGIATLLVEMLSPLRNRIYEQFDLCNKAYPGLARKATAGPGKAARAPVATKKNQPPPLTPAALDVRVGKILQVERVEGSEKLYKEMIDVGEDKPRQIVSGLVPYIPIEEMQGRVLLVVCNLKAAKLAGVTSEGMVLAASSPDKSVDVVELLRVPEGAKIGERVTYEGLEDIQPDLPTISRARLDKLLKDLKVDDNGVAVHRNKSLNTSAGPCTSKLIGGPIR